MHTHNNCSMGWQALMEEPVRAKKTGSSQKYKIRVGVLTLKQFGAISFNQLVVREIRISMTRKITHTLGRRSEPIFSKIPEVTHN